MASKMNFASILAAFVVALAFLALFVAPGTEAGKDDKVMTGILLGNLLGSPTPFQYVPM